MQRRGFTLGRILLTGAFVAQVCSAQLPRIQLGPIGLETQTVASGLSSPVDLVSAHDGSNRLFVVEQSGTVRILKNGALVATPFLDVSGRIATGGERGLLSVAFHPGFSNAASPGFRKLYTYTSEPVTAVADFTVPKNTAFDNQGVLAEWTVSAGNPDAVDISTRREIFRLDHPQSNHNGAKLAFRASDHYLYISIGDGGNGNDVGDGHASIGNGQSTDRLLGKILRIDPLLPSLTPASADAISANGKYRVPHTNPFVGKAGLDEIYAYGFRNPFRYSFDAPTDRLIVGDVGQNEIEEVDLVRLGGNYGWNRKEGSFLFNPANGTISTDQNPNPAFINPVAEYSHADGSAVIGGFIYRGANIPALTGLYVFGDLSGPSGSGRLFFANLTSHVIQELRLGRMARALGTSLFSIGEDDAHELYVLTGSGQVLKLIPLPVSPALLNLSTRARIETGDNVLIAGFIVNGSSPKSVVLRALGPSLNVNGTAVPGRLPNPLLELRNSAGGLIAMNDNWMTDPQHQQIANFGLAPPNMLESALLASLQPGSYTAVVRGVNSTGIGLAEIFDVGTNKPANAVNLSARGIIRTGDNVMIAGFVVGGSQSRDLLLRALGPSLTARGVAGALANPTLELRNSSGALLAANDNWRSNQAAAINATGIPPTNDNESAILRTLAPGNYTAIVRGVNNSSGVALVEVYQLP